MISLTWAGCFVLFFFIYLLVLAPQKQSEKQIERQLAEKEQMYESALKATREETKFRLNEQIEYFQNSLKDFVIDFEDSANLIFDISQIANDKGVASFSIKGKEVRGGSEIPNCNYIRENHISISFITADFNQFATFLNALERYRPVVFIDKFKIIRSNQDGSGHQVNMDLAVFVRKQQGS